MDNHNSIKIINKRARFNFKVLIFSLLIIPSICMGEVIITDGESNTPLAKASIFDKNGVFIAVADEKGKVPQSVSEKSYPINVRYVGYTPVEVQNPNAGIVKMKESTYTLPEITVDDVSRNHLYIKAYERTYENEVDPNDTLLYFTERIVDFVLPLSKAAKNKGWKKGRVLSEREYAHVKQQRKDKSRDSIRYRENKNNNSFGYQMNTDFIIPEALIHGDSTKVVIPGKYYPKEIWTKVGDNYVLLKDNLADQKDHINSPALLKMLGGTVDITRDEYIYNFSPDSKGKIKPDMINEASYFLDLYLKGKIWKMASQQKEDLPLQCYGELYVIDRAYLTADEVKELKKNPPVVDTSFEAPEGIPAPPTKLLKLKEAVKEKYPEAH